MTKLNLNDAQLEAIHGGMDIGDRGEVKPPPPVKFIGEGNLGGGGIGTETLQQSRDLPGA